MPRYSLTRHQLVKFLLSKRTRWINRKKTPQENRGGRESTLDDVKIRQHFERFNVVYVFFQGTMKFVKRLFTQTELKIRLCDGEMKSTLYAGIVLLPAYRAEKTLEKTVKEIPKRSVDEIILVDDASNDRTSPLARKLGLTVKRHEANLGYGGNQKTCYNLALKHDADIVVMLHPDYQYDPKLIPYFVDFISKGYFDVMLGTRMRTRKEALAGGMPKYKYFANRFLTMFENIVSGRNLSEWHTGMRAYRREVLENIEFMSNSDDFVFETQVLFQIVEKGYKIGEIPVPVRYFPEASSINFTRSVRYGIGTVITALKYLVRRIARS